MSKDKQSLLATGLNGLVGTRLVELNCDKYDFDSLDLRDPVNPVDITKLDDVRSAFENSTAKNVVHLAAYTNVSAAWDQRGNRDGLAYQVNVNGTQNIIQACQEFDKHLIHISTAYVFDGEKENKYTEDDQPNPIEWYGQTKWEAEQAVMNSEVEWTILRIDQPFRPDPFEKTDIAHRILQGLKSDNLYPMFTNHYFGPTFIDDFAKTIEFFAQTKTTGLFHATSGEKWSDYEFALAIKELHNLPGEVKKGDLDQYLETLNRPYQRNTALNTDKLEQVIDFKLSPIREAVGKLRS